MSKKLPDKFSQRERNLKNILLFTAAAEALCNHMKPVWGEKAEIAIIILKFVPVAYLFIAPAVGSFVEDDRRKRQEKLRRPAPRKRGKKAAAVLNNKLS